MIHTKRLAEVMIGFCMNALTSFSKNKGAPLNPLQIEQVVDFEIQAIIHQIQMPKMIAKVKEIAIDRFNELHPFK